MGEASFTMQMIRTADPPAGDPWIVGMVLAGAACDQGCGAVGGPAGMLLVLIGEEGAGAVPAVAVSAEYGRRLCPNARVVTGGPDSVKAGPEPAGTRNTGVMQPARAVG